jgi:hypothetical protein
MVVYNLECKLCDSHYVGKTQQYLKDRTNDHFYDVWKVVETGKKKFGPNWKGSGGYARADAFAKHFAQHCRDWQKLKTIVTPTIIWQGDSIRCAKTARTLQCKICMTERKEILHRFCTDKSKIMNDNSDIYSSCKCKGRFHRFGRKLHIETPRTRSPQKKVNSTRSSKPRRARFSFNLSSPEAPVTPEPASPRYSTKRIARVLAKISCDEVGPCLVSSFHFSPGRTGIISLTGIIPNTGIAMMNQHSLTIEK